MDSLHQCHVYGPKIFLSTCAYQLLIERMWRHRFVWRRRPSCWTLRRTQVRLPPTEMGPKTAKAWVALADDVGEHLQAHRSRVDKESRSKAALLSRSRANVPPNRSSGSP